MTCDAMILAVHCEFAEKILQGVKTVELRRVRPKYLAEGWLCVIYVPSPMKAVVGAFEVGSIVEEPVRRLWHLVRGGAGVTRQQFLDDFRGASRGVGISIARAWRFPQALGLKELRAVGDFQPPQGFRYVREHELALSPLADVMGEDREEMRV